MNLYIRRITYLYLRGNAILPFSIDIRRVTCKSIWSLYKSNTPIASTFYSYTVKDFYCIRGTKVSNHYIEEILLLEWDNLIPTLRELRMERYRTRSPMAWVQTLYPLIKDLNTAINIMKKINKAYITWEEYLENLIVIDYEMPG